MNENDEMREGLSRALDEIYELRKMLACEARILEAHLEYKTFPKSRRQFGEDSVHRMREAAKGNVARQMGDNAYRFGNRTFDALVDDHGLRISAWLTPPSEGVSA